MRVLSPAMLLMKHYYVKENSQGDWIHYPELCVLLTDTDKISSSSKWDSNEKFKVVRKVQTEDGKDAWLLQPLEENSNVGAVR